MKSFELIPYACNHSRLLVIKYPEKPGKDVSFVITTDEMKCLMQTIQSVLPMEVCEGSDIKHLNRRLREAEAKIVSLELAWEKFVKVFQSAHDILR